MARVNTKLDDWEIADAVEEIKRLKFEKSISWDYIFKHYPNNGSSSGSALMKAVSKHSSHLIRGAWIEIGLVSLRT